MKLLREQRLVHKMLYLCGLQQIFSYIMDSDYNDHLELLWRNIVWMNFKDIKLREFSLNLSV